MVCRIWGFPFEKKTCDKGGTGYEVWGLGVLAAASSCSTGTAQLDESVAQQITQGGITGTANNPNWDYFLASEHKVRICHSVVYSPIELFWQRHSQSDNRTSCLWLLV